mmetsp:Transcript_25499/g.81580  ORF Transcript_25499/g.81580 Transcript_25499/m.81580 type:complete len:245 (+) Transcript_25499:791-1525(+)
MPGTMMEKAFSSIVPSLRFSTSFCMMPGLSIFLRTVVWAPIPMAPTWARMTVLFAITLLVLDMNVGLAALAGSPCSEGLHQQRLRMSPESQTNRRCGSWLVPRKPPFFLYLSMTAPFCSTRAASSSFLRMIWIRFILQMDCSTRTASSAIRSALCGGFPRASACIRMSARSGASLNARSFSRASRIRAAACSETAARSLLYKVRAARARAAACSVIAARSLLYRPRAAQARAEACIIVAALSRL